MPFTSVRLQRVVSNVRPGRDLKVLTFVASSDSYCTVGEALCAPACIGSFVKPITTTGCGAPVRLAGRAPMRFRARSWTASAVHVVQPTRMPSPAIAAADDGVASDAQNSPTDVERYKLVKIWPYGGSDARIPWLAIGDILFEMGAVSVSVSEEKANEADPGAHLVECGDDEARPTLTFFMVESADVSVALEAACSLTDSHGFLGAVHWEEGPLECLESWEATRRSDGFEPITVGRRLRILPVQRYEPEATDAGQPQNKCLRLLEGPGWGDGEHPSTWMCLDFLERVIQGGEAEVIDYGTGSGVLAAAAALLGAEHVTAVDVDFEILSHARQNFLLNGLGQRVRVLHTREVSIGDLAGELVVVNMMAGPMLELMPVLVVAVQEGGLLCLSGLRPGDVPAVKSRFGEFLDWNDDLEAARKAPKWGEYARLVGRPKEGLRPGGALRRRLELDLAEAAVS